MKGLGVGAEGPGWTTGAVMVMEMAIVEAVLEVAVARAGMMDDKVGVGVMVGSVMVAWLRGVLVLWMLSGELRIGVNWPTRAAPTLTANPCADCRLLVMSMAALELVDDVDTFDDGDVEDE